jgi:myo-inositol-1(or 4)-monophosphatase
MSPILNIAKRAARQGGAFLLRERERLDMRIDAVEAEDLLSKTEALLIDVIQKSHPKHGIASTFYEAKNPDAEIVWHLQIVAGKENLMRNIPSVALVIVITNQRQVVEHALVFEPYTDEIFTATEGSGAQCNRYRLRGTKSIHLNEQVMLGCYFESADHWLATQKLSKERAKLMVSQCPVMAMAYVAAGRLDGFVGQGLTALDVMAGQLFIKETGGLSTDFSGDHHSVHKGEVVAGSPKLLKSLLQALR